ncbi:hypothetical protein [Aurantiacibacter gangjinensis]|nr:hypothetical protein [Aurantiacibacter gangjinensis]
MASTMSVNPVFAQDETEEQGANTIIVDGQRIDTADIRSTARDITIGSYSYQVPLARFTRPVCAGVWGLGEDIGQAISDRIMQNAAEIGAEVSDEVGCGANIWVIVVDDVEATFTQLEEDDSHMTRHLTPLQVRKIRSEEGSARGWSVISTRNPDTGLPVPTGFEATQRFFEGEFGTPVNQVSSMSRSELGIRTDIELSVVLLERSALADLDTDALGDYATMRLLAYTDVPDGDTPVSTILSLFIAGDAAIGAPQRMTAFDRAYLRALYRSSPVRPARMAIGNISALMDDEQDIDGE